MALNYVWFGFIIIGFLVALIRLIFFQDMEVFPAMLNATFDKARTGFEISIYLTGVMSLWLGIMKIGEKGGVIQILSRLVGPFFSRLFPEVPRDHPATGSIIMNFSANMLGLDNAATPLGLKAMKELQEINPNKETASNAQIMFLVLNTSGLTIIPLTILLDRSVTGASNPADVFLPILIATYCSSLAGLIIVSIYQKINLFDRVVMAYIVGFSAVIALATYYFSSLPQEALQLQSNMISSLLILSVIVTFLVLGFKNKVPLFETFIEGAKEGFQISIKIIPYLVGFLVAIGIFIASGSMEMILGGIAFMLALTGMNTDFVDALPVAFLKPMSGGNARAMMLSIMNEHGPDSFVGRLASIFRGCTETTFYVLAVYFGSVGIRNSRYAVTCGLTADFVGIIVGILVGYLFFH